MSQICNDNTKRPKPQDIQLGILKIYAFSREFKHRASGPGEGTAGVRYFCMRIHPKTCCRFPLKVAATLLNGSRKGAVGA